MNLTDFLTARINEAAAEALHAYDVTASVPNGGRPVRLATMYVEGDVARLSSSAPGLTTAPSRVLAECEAKRRIVELHEPEGGDYGPGCFVCNDTNYLDGARLSSGYPCDTLKLLALPYADHRDYREEWRP